MFQETEELTVQDAVELLRSGHDWLPNGIAGGGQRRFAKGMAC